MDILALTTDLMDRSVIQQVLQHSGHRVTFVRSEEDVWRHVDEGAFRFVILDEELNQQGYQPLMEKIRAASASLGWVYIILLVSKSHNGDLIANLGLEADDYIVKPIAPQELKARVAVGARYIAQGDELLQARIQIERLAVYDTLTGLLNRQAFYKAAQGELERARRIAQGLSVIALDIDNFKHINETYGDVVGDDVLKIVSRIIREKSRPYDCVGRWGGDQFIIILPGTMSADAEKITTRIITGVQTNQIFMMDGAVLEVKLSAGIAATQNINAYMEIETFIQNAIQAMRASQRDDQLQISVVYI